MFKNPKFAATLAAALAFGLVGFSMWTRHSSQSFDRNRVQANAMEPIDNDAILRAIRGSNLAVSDLSVRSIGGIVILRGNGDAATAEKAVSIVKSLGPTRVANLITPDKIDDSRIQRDAERQLAATNSLAGCLLTVHCQNGVLSVSGTVQHELQKDAARSALRAVRGAREIRVDLTLS